MGSLDNWVLPRSKWEWENSAAIGPSLDKLLFVLWRPTPGQRTWVERLLNRASRHSSWYETKTADWAALDNGRTTLVVLLAHLVAANVHYGPFGKLVEGSLPKPQLQDDTSHYGPYGEFVEGPRLLLAGSID